MEEIRVFDRENTIPAVLLLELSKKISSFVMFDDDLMLEFYSIRYKRKIDTFVLGYYPPQNIWSLQEPVESFLLEWDHGTFVNASDEDKKIFAEENAYNNWSWILLEDAQNE